MTYAELPGPRVAPRKAARPRALDQGGWSRVQVGWPVVALVATLLGSVVAILVWVPASDQRGQTIITIIASALASLLGAMFAARRAENAVQQQQTPTGELETEQPETPIYRPYNPPDDGTGGGPTYPTRRP